MGIFIPMDNYMVILAEVGRWKVIGMKSLYDNLKLSSSYSLFCRQVRKLESEGLIRSIIGMGKRKYLTLTTSGSEMSPYNAQYDDSDTELNHDLVVSKVIAELNKFETLGEGHVLHESDFFQVEPDGLIYLNKDGQLASIAIEVELTQKAKPRINSKFAAYNRADCFTYCLYIFNKESVYRAYKRQLESMNKSIHEQILMMVDTDLSISQFNYLDKPVFYMGKETQFEKVFGNKKRE
jgi:hypothetical protein